MKKHLERLRSIFSETNLINKPQLFFNLLHEFASILHHPDLEEKLNEIRSKEQAMTNWVNQIPHSPSEEDKKLYFQQYKCISVWYSLNQIAVFFERYDFGFHDFLIQRLIRKNIDVQKLQHEHTELMKYVSTGTHPAIFPTIDEYRQYMRRIINSLDDFSDNIAKLTVYPFCFKPESNQLLIEGYEPIDFIRNKNTSMLMLYLTEKKWKKASWNQVQKELDFEPKTIKRTLRQINERIPYSLPEFLMTTDHPSKLSEKIIIVSGSYKLSN